MGFCSGPSSRFPIIPDAPNVFSTLKNLPERSASLSLVRLRMNQFQEGRFNMVPPAHNVSSSGWATITAATLGFVLSINLILSFFQLITSSLVWASRY
jgi:hypothetical protein